MSFLQSIETGLNRFKGTPFPFGLKEEEEDEFPVAVMLNAGSREIVNAIVHSSVLIITAVPITCVDLIGGVIFRNKLQIQDGLKAIPAAAIHSCEDAYTVIIESVALGIITAGFGTAIAIEKSYNLITAAAESAKGFSLKVKQMVAGDPEGPFTPFSILHLRV